MTTIKTESKSPLIQRISYYLIIAAIVVIFIPSGIMKFTNAEELVNNFSKWNLLSYKEMIGVIELLAVAFYLIPKTNIYGVLLLTFIMLGAIYTHFSHDEPYFFQSAIILVLWINRLIIKPKHN